MTKKRRKILAILTIALAAISTMELLSQIAFRVYKGSWYWVARNRSSRNMVQPHPYFGAAGLPNVSDRRTGIHIAHNSRGFRGPEFAVPKPAGVLRVACLGGSTTYCVGVSEHQTWPFITDGLLPQNVEMVNMGGPGGTSVETGAQAALLFSDIEPRYALFLLGWNDARVQHVKNLKPDWSDYHGRWMMSFGLNGRSLREYFATTHLIKRFLIRVFIPDSDPDRIVRTVEGDSGQLSDQIDARALNLYKRNLRNIVALCKTQGVKPIFIPQVLNWPLLTSDEPYGFLPFVRDRDLREYMDAYNKVMKEVAEDQSAGFVSEVFDIQFESIDWIDNGHFSEHGHRKFANAISEYLTKEIQKDKFLSNP